VPPLSRVAAVARVARCYSKCRVLRCSLGVVRLEWETALNQRDIVQATVLIEQGALLRNMQNNILNGFESAQHEERRYVVMSSAPNIAYGYRRRQR
jgi:hypothetical protein